MAAKTGKGKKILPEGGLSALVQKTDEEIETGEEVATTDTPETPAAAPETPVKPETKETPADPVPALKEEKTRRAPSVSMPAPKPTTPPLSEPANGNGNGVELVTPKPDEDIEVIGRLIKEFGKMPLELERVEKAPKTFRIPKAHIEAMRYIDTYRGLLGDKRLFTDKVVSMIHKTITDELPVIQKKLDELAEIENRGKK